MRGRPVQATGEGWRTPGYAHLSELARSKGFTEPLRPSMLAGRVRAVAAIGWPEVQAIHGDVTGIQPEPGRMVLDGPYLGTTGYGADMTRASVLNVARRWDAVGALVGVGVVGANEVGAIEVGANDTGASDAVGAKRRSRRRGTRRHAR